MNRQNTVIKKILFTAGLPTTNETLEQEIQDIRYNLRMEFRLLQINPTESIDEFSERYYHQAQFLFEANIIRKYDNLSALLEATFPYPELYNAMYELTFQESIDEIVDYLKENGSYINKDKTQIFQENSNCCSFKCMNGSPYCPFKDIALLKKLALKAATNSANMTEIEDQVLSIKFVSNVKRGGDENIVVYFINDTEINNATFPYSAASRKQSKPRAGLYKFSNYALKTERIILQVPTVSIIDLYLFFPKIIIRKKPKKPPDKEKKNYFVKKVY